jgi:two-component sensor histidine kinase
LIKIGNRELRLSASYQSKIVLRVIFGILIVALIMGVIIFTQNLVDELSEREKNLLGLYLDIYEQILDPETDKTQAYFMLKEIEQNLTLPFLLTDAESNPIYPFAVNTINIPIPSDYTIEEQREYLNNLIKEYGSTYEPIEFRDVDGRLLNKFYYSHSPYIDKISYFPIVAIMIVSFLIVIGYFTFSNFRNNEEQKVWVGMSKEAAHQLGTPLSSLLAWMEILKYSIDDPAQIQEALSEMNKDIDRLNTIATRFSKIGSEPELKRENIKELIETTSYYFDKRLPHLGRKVTIIRKYDEKPLYVKINIELFSWVFENLIKNAAEAIDTKQGTITFSTYKQGSKAFIVIKDTGKGMNAKTRKQVFSPGFTTKKRGWGLGLSLTKRIVEQYHSGKIIIRESAPGVGTTFLIELPIA